MTDKEKQVLENNQYAKMAYEYCNEIERFKSNAEFQREQGDLQGCLEFRELADELDKLEKIEQIVKQVESLHPEIAIGDREGIRKIKKVLEQE